MVQVVATKSALQFVGKATLEGLSRREVLTGIFKDGCHMDHIHLADWADIMILCPASANTVNRLAQGLTDNLIGALFLAMDRTKPYLLVPAMNTRMWEHPTVRRSIDELRSWGVHVMEPAEGLLACGAEGSGRLPEVDDIAKTMQSLLFCKDKKRILITGGGTSEAIDDVRVLSNTSTGATATRLAYYLTDRGHSVCLLHSKSLDRLDPRLQHRTFTSHQDLSELLKEELQEHYDALIHLAAVSDYGVEQRHHGKLNSNDKLEIKLKPLAKIVDFIRRWSQNPDIKLIAFKLTSGLAPKEREAKAMALLDRCCADWVVQNDLTDIHGDEHHCVIHSRNGIERRNVANKEELAQALEELISKGASTCYCV